jgi:PAS domain S-box-containing protein
MQLRLNIRSRLFFSILLIFLVSYAILIYTIVSSVYISLQEKLNQDLGENLKFAQHQYLERATIVKYALAQPASAILVREKLLKKDRAWLQAALQRWQQVLPFIEVMDIVDENNRVLARSRSSQSGDRFELADIVAKAYRQKEAVTATEIITQPFVCREAGSGYCEQFPFDGKALMITVVIPVFTPEGRLLGGIVAGDIINRDPQIPFQVQEIFGKEVEVIITEHGRRIASSLGAETPLPDSLAPEILSSLEKGRLYRGQAVIGNRTYVTVFAPLTNSRKEFVGSLSVALSMEHVRKIRRDTLVNILASAIVGILLTFILAFLTARKLAEPLLELTQGAQRIEGGDLSQRVVVDQDDEVGMLANSFNRMAGALAERDKIIKDNTRELKELNEKLERKVAERTAELRMEMGRLEAILTSMADGVVVTDHANRVILCNPAAQKIFDLVPHRVLDQPIAEVCEAGGFCVLVDYIQQMREEGAQAAGREDLTEVRGKKLKISSAPLLDEAGGFAGAVMSIRDVTMEGEVDRMKNEFISTVSHELKTPLTSIKGSLQFILTKGKWLTDTERELLSVCQRNTDRLIRLINDILDVSKIEAGKVELNFKPDLMAELVMYAVDEIKGYAMSRNVTIINNVGSDLPRVYCDHDRLIQVVTNLLANAVKFSPEGKIVMVSAKTEGNYVTVSVADFGRTIQWSDRGKLFKKFQQISRAENMERGGTGLGLAICKEIIERHHGRIFYQEGIAGGNIFSFSVPVFEEQ